MIKENGLYSKTWTASEFTEGDISVDENNYLLLRKSVVISCEQATYGDQTVCLEIGSELHFGCRYPLGDVTLSSELGVYGHDEDVDAEGEGKS